MKYDYIYQIVLPYKPLTATPDTKGRSKPEHEEVNIFSEIKNEFSFFLSLSGSTNDDALNNKTQKQSKLLLPVQKNFHNQSWKDHSIFGLLQIQIIK